MASGIEAWLFGYAGTRLADRILELLRGDKLTADLHKAVQKWADELPADAKLDSTNALFPSHIPDEELTSRPCLSDLRSELKRSKVPREKSWLSALIEQWNYVRENVTEPQNFFLLSEEEASRYLKSMAIMLSTVCSQHEALFRATTISLLRELLEKSNNEQEDQKDIVYALSEDQKKLLRRLYQHKGLCRIAAPKGEYECLRVPGVVTDMQWGWERTPEECRLSGKEQGSRENRLHWIYVVKDLVEAGIFEAQDDGYYEFTEKGWRAAHNVVNE